MTLWKALLVASFIAASVCGHELAPDQLDTIKWCSEPIEFYNDCGFKEKVSTMSAYSGFTLDDIPGEPKAIVVPAGCRVTLFTKSYASYSSHKPSHGLLMKGPKKGCLKDNFVPKHIQIEHDVDLKSLATKVTTLETDDRALRKEVHELEGEMKSSPPGLKALQTEVQELEAKVANMSSAGWTGSHGNRGSPGASHSGSKDGMETENNAGTATKESVDSETAGDKSDVKTKKKSEKKGKKAAFEWKKKNHQYQ